LKLRLLNHVKSLCQSEQVQIGLILLFLLNCFFFPVIWGNKTLMTGVRDAPSIMPGGAYGEVTPPVTFNRTPDPGAPAWCYEPAIQIVRHQYGEKNVPLWNPYGAFGAPLAADMIAQPFYPPSLLLLLNPTMQSYDLFIIFKLFLAGFFTYLFLRLFLNKLSSLFGSIAFMFSGYFILFINMPHLSVEILLPAVCYCFELLLRKSDPKRLVFAALVIFLTIVGGMPESTFLILVFGYLYYFFRLVTHQPFRSRTRPHLKHLVLANILGFALAAPLLAPFLEFMGHSYDLHQPANTGMHIGLAHNENAAACLIYLVPMVFGGTALLVPAFGQGYWGILCFLFAVLAVLSFFRLRKNLPSANWLVVFFTCAAVLMLMKRFGVYPVNLIGQLPLFNLVIFYKYQEPLLGFAVAVLAGFGFSVLSGEKRENKYFIPALSVTAGIVVGLVLYWAPAIARIERYQNFTYVNIAAALTLILFVLVLYLIGRQKTKFRAVLPHMFVLVMTAELFCNYILPSFYTVNKLPDNTADPYQGAPYIRFLQENTRDYSRIFGRDNILFPNWSGVFSLFDVRWLNAMTYEKYINFIRNFLADEAYDKKEFAAPFTERFTGSEKEYLFNTLLEQRFLRLSAVKYVLTMKSYALPVEDREAAEQTSTFLTKRYDEEIKIYEVANPLPRTAIFYRVEPVDSGDRVLARLKDPALDIRQSALVWAPDLTDAEKELIGAINQQASQQATPAQIEAYDAQRVLIKTQLNQPGLLVLNDTFYPGWKAYVDGKEARILSANYLFRGVLLDKGAHQVEFRYEPASFRLGLLMAVPALAALLVLTFNSRRSPATDH